MDTPKITKQQFQQIARSVLEKNQGEQPELAQAAANNRVVASQLRGFDPELGDLIDQIATAQERVVSGFQQLAIRVQDKLEK